MNKAILGIFLPLVVSLCGDAPAQSVTAVMANTNGTVVGNSALERRIRLGETNVAAETDYIALPVAQAAADTNALQWASIYSLSFTLNGIAYSLTNSPVISVTAEGIGAATTGALALVDATAQSALAVGTAAGDLALEAYDDATNAQARADIALAAAEAAGDSYTVLDSSDPAKFTRWQNGTGTVYVVTGPLTNYTVTLSEDFEETVTHTRPAWTTNVFPFTDALWSGGIDVVDDVTTFFVYWASGEATAYWTAVNPEGFPTVLTSTGESAAGTVSLNAYVYYLTNLVDTVASGAALDDLRADFDGYHPPTADVIGTVNPQTLTLYGDLATTNVAGYAVLGTNNPAASSSVVAVDPTIGYVVARVLYEAPEPLALDTGTAAFSFWGKRSLGGGTSVVDYAVTALTNANLTGVPLVSGTTGTIPSSSTNLLFSASAATDARSGVLGFLATFTVAGDPGTQDIIISDSGTSPITLTTGTVPIDYPSRSTFDAHAADTGLHVTAGKQDAWDSLTAPGYLTLTNGLALFGSWSTNGYPTVVIRHGTTNFNIEVVAP